MSTLEEIRQDAKRDDWYDKNTRPCPMCRNEVGLVCVERFAATRIDPACELWQCRCGHEEEA